MKLGVFKKVCLTVMGIGVVGSLVSVGTFATFTAVTTNPGNTFAAGTLLIDNVIGDTSGALTGFNSSSGSNITQAASNLGTAATCTGVVSSACGTVIQTSKIAGAGMESGQYVQGQVTVKNTGTLPATFQLQLQNIASTASSASFCSGVAGGACAKLGDGISIAIEDLNGPGNAKQCIYGKNGTTTLQGAAPTQVVSSAAGNATPVACNAALTTPTSAGLSTAPQTNEIFGSSGSSNTFFTLGSTTNTSNNSIYIPGKLAVGSCPNGNNAKATYAGVTFCQWDAGETHTFTITMVFPDTGTSSSISLGTNSVTVGTETKYEGGSVGFDMIWFSAQQ